MRKYLQTAIEAAILAGEKIMEVYEKDFEIEWKQDNSPLTEADKRANAVILQTLKPLGLPVISEEIKNTIYAERADWEVCWMVDPLDGTKEFVKRNGEFTVNIALIKEGCPVLGVVYLPVTRKLYFAVEEKGSYLVSLEEDRLPDLDDLLQKAKKLKEVKRPQVFTVVASRSHLSEETEKFIEKCRLAHGEVAIVSRGSSLKLCMVAEGLAHVYPRIAPTMEWDTAAAHAVAKYAGCEVLDFHTGDELKYNKENLLNPFFIVRRKTGTNAVSVE